MAARGSALRVLQQFERGRIDRIADELHRERLEPREAALAGDLANGVVRNERFLDFVLALFVTRGLPKDPKTRSALRMGAFQLLLLDGMPPRAAVHETVELLQRDKAFVNAVLRRVSERVQDRPAYAGNPHTEIALSTTRTLVLPEPGLAREKEILATRHSLPDFLVARWRAQHGDLMAQQIAAAASVPPAMFLRACGGRTAADLARELDADAVRTTTCEHPRMLRVEGGAPFGSSAFQKGGFVVQDPTAVVAAEAVEAKPGMTIVDLCAAPGTKATLLAELVGKDGVVFAYDPDPKRRERIAENAARLSLQGTLRVVDQLKGLPAADAVLADVPCSNTGVLSRRVEVRRRLEEGTFAAMALLQQPILEQAVSLSKPGGAVVYSTCSIEPEENVQVVTEVAREHGLRIEREHLSLPKARTGDGGYYARLRQS